MPPAEAAPAAQVEMLSRLDRVRGEMDGLATVFCQAQAAARASGATGAAAAAGAEGERMRVLIEEAEDLAASELLGHSDQLRADFVAGCGWHMLGDSGKAMPALSRVAGAAAGQLPPSDHLSAIWIILPLLRRAEQWREIDAACTRAREVAGGAWVDHTLPYMKGVARLSLGQPREAATLLEEAIDKNAGFRQAYVEYDKAMTVLRDFQACRRMAQRLVDRGGHWVNCWQRPDHFLTSPPLASRPWHDAGGFPLARALEAGFEQIRAELHAYLASGRVRWGQVGSQERGNDRSVHDADLVSQGTWSEIVLLGDAVWSGNQAEHFTETMGILQQFPEVMECASLQLGETLFSRLSPGARLRPHCGPSNMRLTCHLGLDVPKGCEIRCGGESRTWSAGRCLVFDDSYEHEVHHAGAAPRTVLLVNFWHPDAPAASREAFMQQLRGGAASAAPADQL